MQSKLTASGIVQQKANDKRADPEDEGIEDSIREFVAHNLLFCENGFPFHNSASFLRHSVVDSLGVIELVTFVERQFQVPVNPEEVTPENFDSVNQLAAFVRRKIQSSKVAPYVGS